MKHQTKLLFHESYMRQYCLTKWKAATKFHSQMYCFEDILGKLKVHKAFRHWKKYTNETAPTVSGLLAEIGKNALFGTVSKLTQQPKRVENSTPTRQYRLQGDFPPIAPAKSNVADISGILIKSPRRNSKSSTHPLNSVGAVKEANKSNVGTNNKSSTISVVTS